MKEDRYPRALLDSAGNTYLGINNLHRYNWLECLRDQFLVHIGEERVLDDIGSLQSLELRNSLLTKYREFSRSEDIRRCMASHSLIVYPLLNSYKPKFLYLNVALEKKSFISQVRLLNIYNTRIIFKSKLYVIDKNLICYFCNLSELDIFHFLFDCPNLHETRLKFGMKSQSDDNNNNILSIFLDSHLNPDKENSANDFVKYVLYVLNTYLANYVKVVN